MIRAVVFAAIVGSATWTVTHEPAMRLRRRQADDQGGEVNDTANTCSECGAPAQFQHPEGDVDIHACARHRCDLCWATDDAEQSEHWDGIVPLGGDSLDGR